MTREEAKDLALSVLIVAAAALAADDVALHWRIGQARQEMERRLAPLETEAAVSAAERAEQARTWKDKWQEKWEKWRKQPGK